MSVVDLYKTDRSNQIDQFSMDAEQLSKFPGRRCSYCDTALRRVCVFWWSLGVLIGKTEEDDVLLHPECAEKVVLLAARHDDYQNVVIRLASDAYIAGSIEKRSPIMCGVVPSLQLWANINSPPIVYEELDGIPRPTISRISKSAQPVGPGWLYVLSNEAHPHLLKIGRTTEDPDTRASSLRSTGVPHPFVVEHKVHVAECASLEAAVHERLKAHRVDPKREFFRVSVAEAVSCVTELAQPQPT